MADGTLTGYYNNAARGGIEQGVILTQEELEAGFHVDGAGIVRDGLGNEVTQGAQPNPLSVRASSSRLGSNMLARGMHRPDESAAHHIVAGGDRRAAGARAQLARFGIGINDAENGVFLPCNCNSANPEGAAVHSKVHTNNYYEYVEQALGSANNRQDAEMILDDIRQQLLNGETFE